MSRIAILGSGAWGTALAIALSRNGHSVVLWSRSASIVKTIETCRENPAYLPGEPIPAQVSATDDLKLAVGEAEIVLSAVPAQHTRAIYRAMAAFLNNSQAVVSATKGIEEASFLRMTEVIEQELGKSQLPLGVLSGPSFAKEVAAGSPTAITIASKDSSLAAHIQEAFSSPSLRLYTNDDVVGVELGGALKNVIAIAAGIATGLGLGHNSVAAIITRGIAEVTRLAAACGGRRETLAGLSGLGDLVLTCTGPLSRNRLVGIELGRGLPLPEILAKLDGKVAEGVHTTSAALGLARRRQVEMPITQQMSEILNQGKSPQEAIRQLMSRPGRDE